MWRSKKLIIGAVLAVVVLVGSIGGVVVADDNGESSQPEAKYQALLGKICEIYQEKTGVAIDSQVLKDSFAQVQNELRIDALKNHVQKLVEQDKITQQQADDYLEWQQARPDVPFGFGHGVFRVRGRMSGFGGPCRPCPPAE